MLFKITAETFWNNLHETSGDEKNQCERDETMKIYENEYLMKENESLSQKEGNGGNKISNSFLVQDSIEIKDFGMDKKYKNIVKKRVKETKKVNKLMML